jgi:hypothetical protein
VDQGPLQKALDYGTVIVVTGNDDERITLVDIENPEGLRTDIMTMMETVASRANSTASPAPVAQSPEDEIVKLASLRDQGIITQEDFDLKKKQLLGI